MTLISGATGKKTDFTVSTATFVPTYRSTKRSNRISPRYKPNNEIKIVTDRNIDTDIQMLNPEYHLNNDNDPVQRVSPINGFDNQD